MYFTHVFIFGFFLLVREEKLYNDTTHVVLRLTSIVTQNLSQINIFVPSRSLPKYEISGKLSIHTCFQSLIPENSLFLSRHMFQQTAAGTLTQLHSLLYSLSIPNMELRKSAAFRSYPPLLPQSFSYHCVPKDLQDD